jgi:hypothetical protein
VEAPPPIHYPLLAEALAKGKVVPFLGAGVNLFDRDTERERWEYGKKYLPNGRELAAYLATRYGYTGEASDLARVSQWARVLMDEDDLYGALHELFAGDYAFNELHALLARLPATLRAKGYGDGYRLVITTNYDDALERAFDAAKEPYDLVWYAAQPKDVAGIVFVRRYAGDDDDGAPSEAGENRAASRIERISAKRHVDLLERRSVILKIHGAVNRVDPPRDSYVIAEDDYIDYLGKGGIWNQIPAPLKAELCESGFLFLGYSMQDWNLRLLFNRIAEEAQIEKKSWAIQLPPDGINRSAAAVEMEEKLWRAKLPKLDIFAVSLKEYIAALGAALDALPARSTVNTTTG